LREIILMGGAKWICVQNAGSIVLAKETKCLNFLRKASITGGAAILGTLPRFAVFARGPIAGAPVGLGTPTIRNGDEIKFWEYFGRNADYIGGT
jgi:hypothetical protein